MTAVLLFLLGCLLILLIIAANGYFVAQEFAYMTVDRNRLRALAAGGDRQAQHALDVTRRTSFMLSGAQLGITVTGLLVGYVAEPLVGEALGTLLGGAGVPAAVSITVGTVLALAVSTVVQMIFGELFPKNYAIANPVPLARGLARSTKIYLAVFGWLISIFDHAANALLRLLRIEPVHDVESSATAKDLERIVSSSRESGDLPDEFFLAFDRVLDFPDHDVEHAMVPRSRTGFVQPQTTIGELRCLMAEEHTRYPVVGHEDEPVGVVHLIDVLGTSAGDDEPVTALMRDPVIVPTLMPLPEAVRRLRQEQAQLACVIDEYGGFAGIVTMEDLAEEVLGEITDEHDDEEPAGIEPAGERQWRVDGDLHLDEVERVIGLSIPTGDYETLSGLLIAQQGGLVEEGQTVRIELPADPADYVQDSPSRRWLDLTVLSIDKHVPDSVLLTVTEESAEGEDR
ncbi:hemolysin family protein [Sediminivirga luteola]|uniref:hemolysin family protein n=1 Tax=Sediminivirga luteola TaxID=1774748 RepID=UPI001F59B3DB|nr:hemolysin family protein [Sediminivirga luteola]MCI2266229.1 hemolysin family protein [Sediminivirga luteola]